MANKRTTRPQGLIPSWANDLNLNDPGEPWDGTPTKVEPGAGKRDDGFLPEENPPAQHVNKLHNEIGQWIQFFSDMQIQNWSLPVKSETTGSVRQSAAALCFDRGTERYIVVGEQVAGNAQLNQSHDGSWWFEQSVAGMATNLTWCASKPPADAPATVGAFYIAGGNASGNIVDTIGAVVTVRSVTGVGSVVNTGLWDGGNGRFAAGGDDGAGAPLLWTSPASAMTWAAGTGIGSPVNSVIVECMAVDDAGTIVAFGDNQTPDLWTSTDGGVSWTLRAPGIVGTGASDEPKSVAYNAELGVWMLLTESSVWTSPDGIAWSKIVDSLTLKFQSRCLATAGSLWVAASATDPLIFYSTDLGATWRKFYVTGSDRGGAFADPVVTGIVFSEHRQEFALVKEIPTDSGDFRRSLSIGTTLLTSEGESVPTT